MRARLAGGGGIDDRPADRRRPRPASAMGAKGGGSGGNNPNSKQPQPQPAAAAPRQEEERGGGSGGRPPRPVSLKSPGGTSAFELHVMAGAFGTVVWDWGLGYGL